jgi:hypothetical protein
MEKPQTEKQSFNWQLVASLSGPILLAGGLLAYAGFALYFDRFYAELGVSPAETGFSYGTILSTATELILYDLIISSVGSLLIAWTLRGKERIPFINAKWSFRSIYLTSFALVYCGVLLASFILSPRAGARWASAVKAGRPVVLTPTGPVISIPLQANPAKVWPADTSKGTLSIDLRHNRSFIYVGQANGIAVLYDTTSQSVFRLPLSSIVLQVSNCRSSTSADPACKNALVE